MVDHHVLNLKMDTKSLPVSLPREFISLSDGSSNENPRNPPLCDRARTRWSRGSGASGDGQIEEKGLKETLVGTSESRGTPLTLNFPLDKSKYFSNLSPWRMLEIEVSLGGAMRNGFQRKTEEDKRRGVKTIPNLEQSEVLTWKTRTSNLVYIGVNGSLPLE